MIFAVFIRSLGHELHAVLRVMWSGKWARISPHAMLQAVWKVIPFFKGYTQQDAQEFLRYWSLISPELKVKTVIS